MLINRVIFIFWKATLSQGEKILKNPAHGLGRLTVSAFQNKVFHQRQYWGKE